MEANAEVRERIRKLKMKIAIEKQVSVEEELDFTIIITALRNLETDLYHLGEKNE